MKDVRHNEVSVGDFVAVASRTGNIAEFRFGTISMIDENRAKFKMINEDTDRESSLMNWYYNDIPRQKYCKVLRLDTQSGGMVD